MKKYLLTLTILGFIHFNTGYCQNDCSPTNDTGLLLTKGEKPACPPETTNNTRIQTKGSNFFLEVKAAYFIPTDGVFRKIYGDTGLYSLDFRFPVYKDFIGWTEVGYLTAHGKTIGLRHRTRIQMVPLVAGLQYSPKFGRFQPFLGLGIDVTYLHLNNNSPFMIHSQGKWGVGGICTAGTLIHLSNSFFIDIFGNYSFVKVSFHNTNHGAVVPRTANLDGFAVGGGVGYHF